MMQRNAFLQKGQLLTRRRSCDRVDNVNGDEGNKYPEVFCPEKPRLVQGAAEQQGKYLPELQVECLYKASRLCRVRALQTQECHSTLGCALVRSFL